MRQIGATVASLQQQLREARGSLGQLEQSRTALEKDISCKTQSLLIDRDQCMSARRRYPALPVLAGY